MSIDFNLDELGTLAKMVEDRAQSELSSVVSRLQSAAIGEASTLFSEGLAIVNKWAALHAKVQAAASAPAEASPAPEPAAPEAPASAPAEEPAASEPAPVEEQPTEQLPAVSPAPESAPAAEAPASEVPAEEAAQ